VRRYVVYIFLTYKTVNNIHTFVQFVLTWICFDFHRLHAALTTSVSETVRVIMTSWWTRHARRCVGKIESARINKYTWTTGFCCITTGLCLCCMSKIINMFRFSNIRKICIVC
jgi:hypothetical protein